MSKGIVVACTQCGQKNRVPYGRLGGGEHPKCGKCHAALAPTAKPIELQATADFHAIIAQSPVPVLVDFWAPWCGPCRMVAPELEKVAARSDGSMLVLKVNTEAHPQIAGMFGIRSIPTMAVFQGGHEVNRTAGARPAPAIEQFVRQSVRAA